MDTTRLQICLVKVEVVVLWLFCCCLTVTDGRGGTCNIQCPRPEDPSTHTVCSTSNGVSTCISKYVFAGIFGGVFGGLFLIGMIILIVCCCLCKKGHIVCVKIYDDGCSKRYTCMTRSKYEAYMARQASGQSAHCFTAVSGGMGGHPPPPAPGQPGYPPPGQGYPPPGQPGYYPPAGQGYAPPAYQQYSAPPSYTTEQYSMSNKAFQT